MKKLSLGPLGPSSYRGSWTENGLRMIERWINTLSEFRGAVDAVSGVGGRDGSDGLVPQPKIGDENNVLFGDGHWRNPLSTGGGGTPPLPGSIPIFDIDGHPTTDTDFRYDPTTDTLYAPHITTQSITADFISSDVVTVDPEVYGPGWDGDNSVPTKNDTYDAIQALAAQVAAVAAVPIFYTTIQIVPAVGIGNEYRILTGAVAVVATTRLVWINLTITGSGKKRKKKRGKASTWTFDVQLKNATTGAPWSLGTVTASIPANSKTTPFKLPLVGSISRLPLGSYNLVLISSLASVAPDALTINVMGQAP